MFLPVLNETDILFLLLSTMPRCSLYFLDLLANSVFLLCAQIIRRRKTVTLCVCNKGREKLREEKRQMRSGTENDTITQKVKRHERDCVQ